MVIQIDSKVDYMFDKLFKRYKKYIVGKKEYCEMVGISEKTLERRIEAGNNIAIYRVDEKTGKLTWNLFDLAVYLVENDLGKEYISDIIEDELHDRFWVQKMCTIYWLDFVCNFEGIDLIGCGGWIWTNDLRVMSPTSYQAAPPRVCWDSYYAL